MHVYNCIIFVNYSCTVSDYTFEYISIISSLVVFVVATTVIQKTTFGFKVSCISVYLHVCSLLIKELFLITANLQKLIIIVYNNICMFLNCMAWHSFIINIIGLLECSATSEGKAR